MKACAIPSRRWPLWSPSRRQQRSAKSGTFPTSALTRQPKPLWSSGGREAALGTSGGSVNYRPPSFTIGGPRQPLAGTSNGGGSRATSRSRPCAAPTQSALFFTSNGPSGAQAEETALGDHHRRPAGTIGGLRPCTHFYKLPPLWGSGRRLVQRRSCLHLPSPLWSFGERRERALASISGWSSTTSRRSSHAPPRRTSAPRI